MTSPHIPESPAAGANGAPAPAAAPPEAQAELERSRTHLALALEAGRMGTWEWDVAGGRVHWSPQQERLHGLEPGTFAGTVEAYRASVHPDDAAPAWARVEEALAGRAAHHHVVHRIVRPGGEVRWLESHGRFVYDAGGRPLRLVGVSSDVTERVRFEHLRERQDEMLGAVDVGLWYCDLPFDVLAWDRTVKEHFWLPPDARVTIEDFYAHLHPDDRARAREAIERSIAERAPYDIEYRTVAPAGHPSAGAVRWVRAIGYTAYGPTGAPVRFDGVTVDVTATKRTAERLVASEQRYEYAARATSNAIWDWDLGTDTIAWNPGVSTVFGYAPAEVDEAASWWYEQIHPDDRDRVVGGIHAVIDGADGGHAWRDEYRFRRADGTYARVADRGYVARDAQGRAARMIGAMEDVTARYEAEAALRRSQERFRALVDATEQYIWTSDPEGRMTGDQPGWARLTGQTPDVYAVSGWSEAVHPDDRAHTLAAWERAVAERTRFEVEHRVRRHDGAWRHFWVRAIPIRDADGAVREWVGIHTDVTDRRLLQAARDRALAEARHERARLQEVFTRSPSAIAVTEGPEHRTVVANAAYGEITGGRPLIGLTVREAFPELEGQGFFDLLDRVYATGEPYVGNEVAAHIDRDGDGAAEEYVFNFTYQPLRDVEGHTTGVLTHAVEITEQVRARQRVERLAAELERERRRLSELLEQAPAAISVTEGPEHVTVSQNAISRRMIGGRDVVGRRLVDVMPDAAEQGFLALLDRVYTTGEPFVGNEMPVRFDFDGDGVAERRYFNFVYQPLHEADGRIRGVLSHAVDVTEQVRARHEVERKAAELAQLTEALERSNRELDQFAYVASHDLKAPLRGIANLTQWIEEDLGERVTGESREHMRLLKGRVHRMEGLIDGILAYSRAGRVRVAPERVDLGRLAREAVELVAPPAGTRVEIADDLPTVVAERVPLQQVLMNLVANAVKFTAAHRPDPVVRVGWRDAGDLVELSVADNGPGIPPEFHDRIWGIFQTLQARDKVEGTGIGLSVVKKIAESRGGRAWLESAPGGGSTFYVSVPKVPPRDAAEAPAT